MYYKIVNDRQVFSQCKVIELNGTWISNPTTEQIASAGWLEYIPPEVVPQPQTEPDYMDIIEAVKKMLKSSADDLSDAEALDVAALYPTWASKIGDSVSVGERLWYDGKLYKVVQSHNVQEDWTPDVVSALYIEVSIEEIPEWVQPVGATGLYMVGDKVTHNGSTWISDYDNNSWEPGVFGWTEL